MNKFGKIMMGVAATAAFSAAPALADHHEEKNNKMGKKDASGAKMVCVAKTCGSAKTGNTCGGHVMKKVKTKEACKATGNGTWKKHEGET